MDQRRAAFDLGPTEEAYLARCRRKTAALFSVACRLGALIGGAGPEADERLAAFGENVGMAFQIFDDILDLAGAPGDHGQAPRHRPLRRHGHAAGDHRDGSSSRACAPTWPTRARARGWRSSATGSPPTRRVEIARERALAFVAAARRAIERGLLRRRRRGGAARDRRRRGGPLLVSARRARPARGAAARPRPAGRRPRGGRRAGGAVLVERGPAPAAPGWSTATRSGPWPSTRAAHAAGRPSEAAVAYGAGPRARLRSPSASPRSPRLAARDRPAARRLPGPGATAPRTAPGSWGVEDLTVVAVCRLALPDGVAVRPHWRRLGPGRVPGGGGVRRLRVAHPRRTTAPTPPPSPPPSAPRRCSRVRRLRVGRIAALNMYPIYHGLERTADPMLSFTDGVPTALNRALLRGELDVSAMSSIAYARHADRADAGAGGVHHRRRRGRLDPGLLAGAVRGGAHGGRDAAQRHLGGAAAHPARARARAVRGARPSRPRGAWSGWTACC